MAGNRKKIYAAIALGCLFVVLLLWAVSLKINGAKQTDAETIIKRYQPPAHPPELEQAYDVIVIGGEPEGVAAAVSAARNGAKTLLVEKRDGLGGLITFGMLNYLDIAQGADGKSVNAGIFAEWHKLVGGRSAVDIDLAKAAFLKLVTDERNLTLALQTETVSPVMSADGTAVNGVNLKNENGELAVSGQRFIDATQDADFAAQCGAPYFVGGEDLNMRDRFMAVTPIIHLTGVAWDGVKQAAREKQFGGAEVKADVAWGFTELHEQYKPVEANTRLRGLNVVRIAKKDGDHFYINALQIFGVNGLDPNERKLALEKGKRETDRIVAFLRQRLKGFAHAQVADYPTELYVRETRHVLTEYQLSMSDVWRNSDQWDSVGLGGYPVDVQATSVKDMGYVMASPEQYAIPFRSLVPRNIDNLLVVGRSAGYSSLAAGSARIIPTGMTTGEAAGAGAALSVQSAVTLRELSRDKTLVEKLRATLRQQGAQVQHFSADYPYKGTWYDDAVAFLMNYGLLAGGYNNELRIEEKLNVVHFANLVYNGVKRLDAEQFSAMEQQLKQIYAVPDPANTLLDRDDAASRLIAVFAGRPAGNNPWHEALELGLIDRKLYDQIADNRVLSRAEGYYLAAHVLRARIVQDARQN